jgi:hypothetical protein
VSDLLPIPFLPDVVIEPLVRLALTEDLGRGGDITTDAVIPAGVHTVALLGAREGGIAAGRIRQPVHGSEQRKADEQEDPQRLGTHRSADAVLHVGGGAVVEGIGPDGRPIDQLGAARPTTPGDADPMA